MKKITNSNLIVIFLITILSIGFLLDFPIINNNVVTAASQERGVASKSTTTIRTEDSTTSDALERVPQGTILTMEKHRDYWYKVSAINGSKIKKQGYIHENHVEISLREQEKLRGIALNNPTNIRKFASTKAGVAKTKSIGTIFDYRTFSTHWYEVVDGSAVVGYVHKKHVENLSESSTETRAIAAKSPTNIRSKPSTKVSVLTTFPKGSTIEYKTISPYWYEVTTDFNGKEIKGYVHKNHVETSSTLEGIALKNPTNIRSEPSTKVNVVSTLNKDDIAKYTVHNLHWNKVNNGYIHKKHISNIKDNIYHGVAKKDTTYIRTEPSTKSNALTKISSGTIFNYRLHNEHWHDVVIKVNGKEKIGYIHKKHMDEVVKNQENLNGITLKSPTNVRKLPSTKSSVVKTFPIGATISYKTYTNSWFEFVEGGKTVGYIHKKHVNDNLLEYTDYRITLNKAVDIQRGQTTKFSRAEYEKYMNPSAQDKFQHLRLDTSLGVSASQLNNILSGKGTLDGQGQAFINGTKKYKVNEAYLISHSILETGHGNSALAQGIDVGLNKNNGKVEMVTKSNKSNLTKIKTTYNMFGIGAFDKCPEKCGSERAYNEGWFSPAQAIEGGADWISREYIQNEYKQDTLYKMKWNPYMYNGAAWKQYATDVAWASKQTARIKSIYDQINNAVYHYDIAKYK